MLAGIFALSGYIPLRGKVKSVKFSVFLHPRHVIGNTANYCPINIQISGPLIPSIPLFFAHGTADRQVNHNFARDAAETLASQLEIPFHSSESPSAHFEGDLVGLRFQSYPGMGHTISEAELEDLCLWIVAILPKRWSIGMGMLDLCHILRQPWRACIDKQETNSE
jgi:predicted esterase